MMRSKPHEEDPNMNMVLRSGATTWEDRGKKPEDDTWVCKAPTKEYELDSKCAKETVMEAKKSFTEVSTSGSRDQPEMSLDPSMQTTFL